MRLAITGSSGFVGSSLLRNLRKHDESQYHIACLAREDREEADAFLPFDLTSEFQLESFLTSTDVIVHCAARVHQMSEGVLESDNQYIQANVVATARLAQQAAAAGVKRFIFLSSVKALGESTAPNEAFRFDSAYNPEDPYGESKAEAEKELLKIAQKSGMEVTIIRAPLVYGPGVKANFASLLKLAEKNLPLPLGSINNARSLVGIQNLVDLIVTCIDHPKAGNQIFMVSDGEDVSTSELLREMTRAYGKKSRLIPFPTAVMSFAAKVLGKQAIAERLFGSLRVDIEHTKNTLGWSPKVTLQEELQRCVARLKGQDS